MNASLQIAGWCAGLLVSVAASGAQAPVGQTLALPGHPFGAVATADQQWVFVSLTKVDGDHVAGLAVLRNERGHLKLQRTIASTHSPLGLVLTHDGRTLVVAADDRVLLYDAAGLESSGDNPRVQWVDDGPRSQSIYANVTADDQTLFVSDESAQSITVIDLSRARSIGRNSGKPVPSGESGNVSEAIVGKIAVGLAPVALTFSEDGSRLFACSEIAPPAWNWPLALERENRRAGREKVPEGAVSIIDVAIARTNPPASEVAHVPAGGSPVRSALSPDGRRLFVSARNSNAVLVFDTDQLVKDPVHARPEKVPVGASPVPVVLVRNGKWAVVGNSNRFSTNVVANSSLTVLDTALIGTGSDPKIGTIACGAFPREFHLSADGKTLYLTNFRSDTLQVMEVARLEQLFEPSNR